MVDNVVCPGDMFMFCSLLYLARNVCVAGVILTSITHARKRPFLLILFFVTSMFSFGRFLARQEIMCFFAAVPQRMLY